MVNNAIQSGQVNSQGLVFLRDNLLAYIRNGYGSGRTDLTDDPVIIQNKVIQTITYLFAALYASEWVTFFDDLLALTYSDNSQVLSNASGIKFYLKALISIHDEIADILVSRSSDEQARDNNLKDLVRQRDAKKIARSWEEVLVQWKTRDSTIVDHCLSTIGRWASWTDLSLIVNQNVLQVLFELISYTPQTSGQNNQQTNLRDISLNTFTEIIAKKMKPNDKLELIAVLKINEVVAQLIASPPLHELRPTSSYDTDLAELVAKLVNNTVFDIVNILDSPSDESTLFEANRQLKAFLPYVLRFFSDEYDEICSSVIPCLTDILTYLRKQTRSDVDLKSILPAILQAIVTKMKYDETSSWGNEDAQTDEAEFQELRKRLQVLQQAVAAVDETLYIETVSNIVNTSLDRFQNQRGQVDWRDIDLALHEMYLFGEQAVKGGALYNKTKPIGPAAERLIGMMSKLVESGTIISCPDPCNILTAH